LTHFHEGFFVAAVTDEREALQAARKEAFDLSIVDLHPENSTSPQKGSTGNKSPIFPSI
jgi:ActR/RegA family two-component response regulator